MKWKYTDCQKANMLPPYLGKDQQLKALAGTLLELN